MEYDSSTGAVSPTLVFVVLLAGCYTGPDLEGPRSGEVVAEEVNETPTNATVVEYSAVELDEVRVAIRNASADPSGFGEADSTESDWRKFERSDMGERVVEYEKIFVRHRERVYRVDIVTRG